MKHPTILKFGAVALALALAYPVMTRRPSAGAVLPDGHLIVRDARGRSVAMVFTRGGRISSVTGMEADGSLTWTVGAPESDGQWTKILPAGWDVEKVGP